MRPNSQLSVDLVTFTEEIINEELHFLYSVWRLKTETSGEFFFFTKQFKMEFMLYLILRNFPLIQEQICELHMLAGYIIFRIQGKNWI